MDTHEPGTRARRTRSVRTRPPRRGPSPQARRPACQPGDTVNEASQSQPHTHKETGRRTAKTGSNEADKRGNARRTDTAERVTETTDNATHRCASRLHCLVPRGGLQRRRGPRGEVELRQGQRQLPQHGRGRRRVPEVLCGIITTMHAISAPTTNRQQCETQRRCKNEIVARRKTDHGIKGRMYLGRRAAPAARTTRRAPASLHRGTHNNDQRGLAMGANAAGVHECDTSWMATQASQSDEASGNTHRLRWETLAA